MQVTIQIKKVNLVFLCIAIILIASANAFAQQNVTLNDTVKKGSSKGSVLKNGLKFNLNEEGTNYVKINFVSQIWVMNNQNNPGSTLNGISTANSFQVGSRRTRLTISSQVTDKIFILGQISSDGISSLAGGRSVPLQFLDMTVEYKLAGKLLSLGAGLSGWDGLSRYSNPSVPSFLGLDLPSYQQATSNITDNTVRMPGIYAKGKLGKLDYRIAANIPYSSTANA
ncbi:MAG: hypothetical protein ABI448_03885, partial [Bacteroidia bacterium]